jgi:hypothetical protein
LHQPYDWNENAAVTLTSAKLARQNALEENDPSFDSREERYKTWEDDPEKRRDGFGYGGLMSMITLIVLHSASSTCSALSKHQAPALSCSILSAEAARRRVK